MKMRLILKMPIILILALATWASAQTRLVVVQGTEPTGVDATLENGMVQLNPALHIMEPLVLRGPDLTLMPWLATSWEYEDPTTLTFTLREGVKFHDGTDFDAEDVKLTIDRIVEQGEGHPQYSRYGKGAISEVVVNSPTSVTFHLVEPRATFLSDMALLGISSKESYERMGAEAYFNAPVGTGPYILDEWSPGIRITMHANPDWWNGQPAYDELVWRSISEDSTRVAELLSGRADIITGVPPSDVGRINSEPDVSVATVPSLRSVWMTMNTQKAPLDDIRVREAINLAVDMDSIIQYILEGNAVRLATIFGPTVFGYVDDLAPIEYDPERARQLLAEAGYGDGLTINMFSYEGRLVRDREVIEAIATQLADVGINVNLQFLEFDQILNYIRGYSDDVDMMIWSNANNDSDANYNLSRNFYSGANAGYWNRPELDALIEQGLRELDPEKRAGIYRKALELIRSEWPILFMYAQVDLYGVREGVPFTPRSDEFIYLAKPIGE